MILNFFKTYTKFLLSFGGHETFFGFLGGRSLFETLAHLSLFTVLLLLLDPSRLFNLI